MDPRAAVAALEGLIAVGCTRRMVVEAVARALGGPDAFDGLIQLDGVSLVREHVTIDPSLALVGNRPDPEVLRQAHAAAAAACLASDELADAGRYAIAAADPALLREAVRAALRTTPPHLGAYDLRTWRDAELLPADDPHRAWLAAACDALDAPALDVLLDRYESVRSAFEQADDVAAEISVGLAASIVARRIDDVGTLLRFIGRAQELVERGEPAATAPALLGTALTRQMLGDPAGAIASIDEIDRGALQGDWAAQVHLVRGTNLMLLGRVDEAIAAFEGATGHGGAWTYAVTLDLLALARWRAGDRVGAIADALLSEQTARSVGDQQLAAVALASRTAMLAADGDADAARTAPRWPPPPGGDQEQARLVVATSVLAAVADDDLAAAQAAMADVEPPQRALRSAHWLLPLALALLPDPPAAWSDLVAGHPALAPAAEAGRVAAAHLAGGPRVAGDLRAFVPRAWCDPLPEAVEVQLLGVPEVRRDGRVVHSAAWDRARVRELVLHLALVGPSSRDLVVSHLWPDLEASAGARNLRVTLSYLLDVLAPERRRGAGTELVEDRGGVLHLGDAVRVDLRQEQAWVDDLLDGAAAADPVAVLRAARRLDRIGSGSILGGSAGAGAWSERHLHARRNRLVRAVRHAGELLLRDGHSTLVESLANRALVEDPWAERIHQLLIRSLLDRDDLDGARSAVRLALDRLAELDTRPELATVALADQLGVGVPPPR